MALRYDISPIRAQRTDDGYIKDTPVITRTGVFPYRNPDGSTRYELRLPEEVFHADSLATLEGIPITNGHPGRVTSKTAKMHGIGTVLSIGRQDGDNLIADIVIHSPDTVEAGNKELSCGYACDLDETPGTWNGQHYDAIQRNIRHNHLAVVGKGRAGNARLNLDAADAAFFDGDKTMTKLRLDNGIEYDAAPEVIQAYVKLKQDSADAVAAKDKAEAERDAANATLADLQAKQPEIEAAARADGIAYAGLLATAKEHDVEIKADAADGEIKAAIIGKLRGDAFDLAGKSADYINAAFDMALADAKGKAQAAAKQRADMSDQPNQQASGSLSAAAARQQMINGKQEQ